MRQEGKDRGIQTKNLKGISFNLLDSAMLNLF